MNPLDELSRLTSLFPSVEPLIASCRYIPKTETPEPYKQMLVHDKHMTVAMESHHGCPVTVEVLADRLDDHTYCREIILHRSDNRQPVQFGIVRFDFQYVSPEVRKEITEKQTPLGRILINHNVLRHVDLGAILEIQAGPGLAKHLAMPEGATTYGRLATIFCNGQPAVDLLEVSSPL